MNFLCLPERTKGIRKFGITSIADFGTPVGQLEHILHDYHEFIDIAKIGIGSAYVTPNLHDKIRLYKKYDIIPYFGGTLFEKCYIQGKLKEYAAYLESCEIEWIEISNGTIEIPLDERLALIHELKNKFNVIAEVGSKDQELELSEFTWVEEIDTLLEAGCKYVITEGRDSGTAGIYDKFGKVKSDIIQHVSNSVDTKKVIFEAPTAKQQMFFINQFGANVNLGNVKLQDVLVLETQRRGLRSETLFLEDC